MLLHIWMYARYPALHYLHKVTEGSYVRVKGKTADDYMWQLITLCSLKSPFNNEAPRFCKGCSPEPLMCSRLPRIVGRGWVHFKCSKHKNKPHMQQRVRISHFKGARGAPGLNAAPQ
jgi:hypothetical protein